MASMYSFAVKRRRLFRWPDRMHEGSDTSLPDSGESPSLGEAC